MPGLRPAQHPHIPIVRSWPAPAELRRVEAREGRLPPHVVDHFPRIQMIDYDYRPLRDWALSIPDLAGVINLEWDIAVSKEDLKRFRDSARCWPEAPAVAPYRLYPANVWAHGRAPGVPVQAGDHTTRYPCFGCIYFPRWVLERWEPLWHDPRMTDTNFTEWFAGLIDRPAEFVIDWGMRPVHLHF